MVTITILKNGNKNGPKNTGHLYIYTIDVSSGVSGWFIAQGAGGLPIVFHREISQHSAPQKGGRVEKVGKNI